MKLKIGVYEVEIKVKYAEYDKKFNPAAAESFLNTLCCFMFDAEERRDMIGLHSIAMEAARMRNDVHSFLEERGYYND